MLFFLKKLVSFFFMPLSISFILLFLAFIYLLSNKYNRAKLFLSLGLVWTFLISYAPFANGVTRPLENQYKSYLDVNPNIKYVLVLGSGHTTNENISIISQMSRVGLTRLSEGIRIYRKLNNAKLIVSGFSGPDKNSHAKMAMETALALGVKKEDIIMQETPKDTYEEALSAKNIVKGEKLVLVTSATHMPRSVKIFKSQGLDIIPAPTYYLAKNSGEFLSIPKASNILKTEASFHEYLGILWFSIVQKIKIYLN